MTNIEMLSEQECMRLLADGEIGRIAYIGRYGSVVLPVNYRLHDGAIFFCTAEHSPLDEDLRTGISNADYLVAFEIDEVDVPSRVGWSVLVQGPAHRVHSAEERAEAERAGVQPWPRGDRELFIRITPQRVTGRRIPAATA